MIVDTLVFGQRLRFFRKRANLTLDELGSLVGKPAPYLSMVENGKREPKLSLISELARNLNVSPAEMMSDELPNRRAQLEVLLERYQTEPMYGELGLSHLKATTRLPDGALEHIIGLYEEVKRRSQSAVATPEEARTANVALRQAAAAKGNYYPDIERLAVSALEASGYTGAGALSQRELFKLAQHFGFSIHQVREFPSAVRSIADQTNGRIFIPQRNELRTRAARSVILRTLGHFALDHDDPTSYSDFLRQRTEAAYFASAVLIPEEAAVPFLRSAKKDRDLSVEDLKERFYVSYEMAGHRLTNLITERLDLRIHLVRSDGDGIIWKAYSNNGVPFPADADGAIEGQRLCRQWGTRMAFRSPDKFAIHYQYTDTDQGTFWCGTHIEADREPSHAITVGTTFDDAQYFRGRNTDHHSVSKCPDGECCRRPPAALSARWEGAVWPSPKARTHVLAALPPGRFPGVDMAEIYEFVDQATP